MASKKKSLAKKINGRQLTSQEAAMASKPRNEFVRASIEQGFFSGSGAHKDKKREAKNGKSKHRLKNFGF